MKRPYSVTYKTEENDNGHAPKIIHAENREEAELKFNKKFPKLIFKSVF